MSHNIDNAACARGAWLVGMVCLVCWLIAVCVVAEFVLEARQAQESAAQLAAVRVWENEFSVELANHGHTNDR